MSRASKLALSSNSRSASEKDTSKLADRAHGTSCTLGARPGDEMGEMEGRDERADVVEALRSEDRPGPE